MGIQIRIFLGYCQNKEFKMHLNQSSPWKEDKNLQRGLIVITHQEKEYIGLFVPEFLTCAQLKEKEHEIKSQLQVYCPKLNLDRHHATILTQLFIS